MDAPQIHDQETTFVIDSPGKADWAIQQIKADRARRDIYVQAAKENIARQEALIREANNKCADNTGHLMYLLDQYLTMVPAKATKTQMSLALPSGKLVRKLPTVDYERDNEALLRWCQEEHPEFVRTKAEPAWAEIKNFILESGDLPDGVSPVEKPANFDIM